MFKRKFCQKHQEEYDEIFEEIKDIIPDKEERRKETIELLYDKYPADHDDCGNILGFPVKCQYNFKPMALFTIFFKDADTKQRIDVVKEIVNFLTETIYSVAGNDKDIEKMLKAI